MKTAKIFPQKLWDLIHNKQFEPAINWSDDGKSIFINNTKLKCLCLGKTNAHFHTEQPKSFVRQLHLYGFRKLDKNQFYHEFFQRDKPDLVQNIHRKYNNTITKNESELLVRTGSPTAGQKQKKKMSNASKKLTNLDREQANSMKPRPNKTNTSIKDDINDSNTIKPCSTSDNYINQTATNIVVPEKGSLPMDANKLNPMQFETVSPVQIINSIEFDFTELRHFDGCWTDLSAINNDHNMFGYENILNLYNNNDFYPINNDITL